MSKAVLQRLRDQFGSAILETHSQFGDDTAVVARAKWREIALFVRDDRQCAMNMFVDITAVDFPERTPRFEVVLHVRSLDKGHRIRLKTRVGNAEGEDTEVDSLVPVWRGADWFERETFDMFGIQFVGHPKLERILMYKEFKGHPLRKDYPANRIQPLVPYREVVNRFAPFGPDEGMSFGRQTHEAFRDDPRQIKES